MKDDAVEKAVDNSVDNAPPYSVFSRFEKGTYVYLASLAAFASPVSSSTYYPAMLTLASDLHVSLTEISLTITTYMVRFCHGHEFVLGKSQTCTSC